MTREEYFAFCLEVQGSSEEELIELLRSTGRVDETNLPLSADLLRKITTEQGKNEIIEWLVSDDYNETGSCNGAIDPAIFLMQPNTITELTYLVANNIKGRDLYCLWNDCGKRSFDLLVLNIWALMSGEYSPEEIEENFRVNHLKLDENDEMSEEDEKWLQASNRNIYLEPFVYRDEIIDLKQFVKTPEDLSPFSAKFKRFVQANKKLHLMFKYLLGSGLSAEDIKFNSKDEIVLSIKMPVIEKLHLNFGRTGVKIQQAKNDPVDSFVINLDQISQLIALKPAAKFYNEIQKIDLCKAIYFLKYSKRRFLPSLAVIRNIPIEVIPNFYINNNDKRYGEIIRASGSNDFHEHIGIFNISYILGLFSESEKESQVAADYVKNHIIGRVSNADIHKLYGTMEPKAERDKDFAEFFMIHHSQNVHCFEDAEGVDKTEQIYSMFRDILALRSEKEIKTTTNRERLTPEDAICALGNACFLLNIDTKYLDYVNVLSKYTSDREEILRTIELLEEAKTIPPEDLVIPYLKDESNASCKFRIIEKGDPEFGITGIKTNCCFRCYGAARKSWEFAITHPDSSVVVFESKKGYTQGWLWYDADNQMLVIDNLEGKSETNGSGENRVADDLMSAVMRFADEILLELNRRGYPCASVNMGIINLSFVIDRTIEKYDKLGLIKKCENPITQYIKKYRLYTDATEQYIISNEELMMKRNGQGFSVAEPEAAEPQKQ